MFTKKAKLTWMFEKTDAKGLKELSQSESHHVRLSKKTRDLVKEQRE